MRAHMLTHNPTYWGFYLMKKFRIVFPYRAFSKELIEFKTFPNF